MLLKREDSFTVSEGDMTPAGTLPAGRILHEFQDIAGDHAEALGEGMDKLRSEGKAWILSKVRFEVLGSFSAGETYRIETYPREKKGVTFYRDYYIYDGDDNMLARGTSHWCIMNFDTRRILRHAPDFVGEYIDHKAFEDDIPKIRSEEGEPAGSHLVTREDIDRNNHTNNCRYGDMVETVLNHRAYSEMIINFSRETVEGDTIEFFTGESHGYTHVEGRRGEEVVFKAMVR